MAYSTIEFLSALTFIAEHMKSSKEFTKREYEDFCDECRAKKKYDIPCLDTLKKNNFIQVTRIEQVNEIREETVHITAFDPRPGDIILKNTGYEITYQRHLCYKQNYYSFNIDTIKTLSVGFLALLQLVN